MARTADITYPNGSIKTFDVIEAPVPHVLVDTDPKFHGWSYYSYQDAGKRECTHERWPLNPYGACTTGCWFCYARRLGVYPRKHDSCGIMTVFRNYPSLIEKRLSKMHAACCGYLSTAVDPFQEVEGLYHHSEKVIELFTGLNVPIEFITKRGSLVTKHVFDMIASQQHSFAQFTIISPDNDKIRKLAPKADTFELQLLAIRRARASGVRHVVARFDPIIPTITGNENDLETMFRSVKAAGATHVVASCVDIPGSFKNVFMDRVKNLSSDFKAFKDIYTNDQAVGKDLNASMACRRQLFGTMRDMATKQGLTFSLCMEFEVIHESGKIRFRGLNEEFATSKACEGIDTPIYYRENLDEPFKALSKKLPACDGNCLASAKGKETSCHGACKCVPFTEARSLAEKEYREMWNAISISKLW